MHRQPSPTFSLFCASLPLSRTCESSLPVSRRCMTPQVSSSSHQKYFWFTYSKQNSEGFGNWDTAFRRAPKLSIFLGIYCTGWGFRIFLLSHRFNFKLEFLQKKTPTRSYILSRGRMISELGPSSAHNLVAYASFSEWQTWAARTLVLWVAGSD